MSCEFFAFYPNDIGSISRLTVRIQSYTDHPDRVDNLVFVVFETIIPVVISVSAFLFNTTGKAKHERYESIA